jgi:hypothetical protein
LAAFQEGARMTLEPMISPQRNEDVEAGILGGDESVE